MSQILTINKSGFGGCGRQSGRGRRSISPNCSILSMKKACGYRQRGLNEVALADTERAVFKRAIFVLASTVVILGAFYLYQVNDLATKGYEIREMENQIAKLQENNEKNKIKETELRSMYNIEKATKESNLVASGDITYLELSGPVAMK